MPGPLTTVVVEPPILGNRAAAGDIEQGLIDGEAGASAE